MGINSIRLPVGDWMYIPYDHYAQCTEGALDEMDVRDSGGEDLK